MTVDMIATGTDIKPLEIVIFMRAVKSRNFFEQMKGRGVRVINPTDLQASRPDAKAKTHFVIVDCRGRVRAGHDRLAAHGPAEVRAAGQAAAGRGARQHRSPKCSPAVAARLARLEKDLPAADQADHQAGGGLTSRDLARSLVEALNADRRQPRRSQRGAGRNPGGVKPFCDPELRDRSFSSSRTNRSSTP